MNPTEEAHGNLNNVLLNGRILINGMPLTANELAAVLRGEQMLFAKASQFDAAQEATKDPGPTDPEKSKIIPIEQGKK